MNHRILTVLSASLRRVVGLHGDAVANAAGSVRRDDQARSHRERVAAEIAAYPDETPMREAERAR